MFHCFTRGVVKFVAKEIWIVLCYFSTWSPATEMHLVVCLSKAWISLQNDFYARHCRGVVDLGLPASNICDADYEGHSTSLLLDIDGRYKCHQSVDSRDVTFVNVTFSICSHCCVCFIFAKKP